MTLRVGFIGLGNQGGPIAAHYAPSGFETTVYDVDEAQMNTLVEGGARAASSPRQVAENADLIGICVPEDEHVRTVITGENGILSGARPGSVILVHSTILPQTAAELAAKAAEQDVALLDACVTGGAARAQSKELTFMVGGDSEALEKARPLLDCTSVRIIHAGDVGSGAKLKLCLNVITYIQWAAASESFALAEAIGLPREVLEEAGKSNGQITPLMSAFLQSQSLPDEISKGEPLQNAMRGFMNVAEKDLAWALQLARKIGVSMPVTGLVSQSMARIYGVEDPGRR
ncbi:MAG: NAD(P)-dependent oxidoreductase [Myxococcota bacterium]|nr:3-hydroxyisobutyrate dehydrogenase [Spirochaeta sp.]RPG07137.1 MAG: NAD(P)-dependent oxidoreductase [Proteobacteria bacterium TMED72]